MSAISLKSITGITSITTPAGVDNQLTLHNNNTTEAVKLDIAGNLHINNQLAVVGVSTLGSGASGQVRLDYQGNQKLKTHTWGVEISGALSATNIVAGATDSTFKGASFSGNIDANGDLDVDGLTNLDNTIIAGIATFTNVVTKFGAANGGNTHLQILSSGSGEAGIFFDAANGDISGSDYCFIGQQDNLDFIIKANPNAGNIDFQRGTDTKVRIDTSGNLNVNYDLDVTGIIKGYKYTAAPYSGTITTLNVTVASKVSGEHRYHGQGSALGYVIDGLQSPFFTLTPGRTYRFDQSDSSNTNHRIKFYLESDKTTLYEEGVTYSTANAGSSGAYTQIVVSDTVI